MAFDEWLAEISLLLSELDNTPQDPHEVHLKLRQILETMKAEGLPLPDDLVKLEQDLDTRFAEER